MQGNAGTRKANVVGDDKPIAAVKGKSASRTEPKPLDQKDIAPPPARLAILKLSMRELDALRVGSVAKIAALVQQAKNYELDLVAMAARAKELSISQAILDKLDKGASASIVQYTPQRVIDTEEWSAHALRLTLNVKGFIVDNFNTERAKLIAKRQQLMSGSPNTSDRISLRNALRMADLVALGRIKQKDVDSYIHRGFLKADLLTKIPELRKGIISLESRSMIMNDLKLIKEVDVRLYEAADSIQVMEERLATLVDNVSALRRCEILIADRFLGWKAFQLRRTMEMGVRAELSKVKVPSLTSNGKRRGRKPKAFKEAEQRAEEELRARESDMLKDLDAAMTKVP